MIKHGKWLNILFGMLSSNFSFFPNFFRTCCKQAVKISVYSDQTAHNATSDLGIHCLTMSLKRDARLIRVNSFLSEHGHRIIYYTDVSII